MNTITISFLIIISIAAIVFLTSQLKIKAFISLFLVSLFLAVFTIPAEKVVSTIKDGFGSTMGSIGFLIIFGTIIGVALDKTGGTLSIAGFILSKTGRNRSSRALGITGFITGLPIFCDSGFIILSGLAKSFSIRSKIAMPFMATVLATSLYSVHCLIPPHPGASAAAIVMGADIGNLILLGIGLAIPGAAAAYLWSRWMSKKGDFKPADEIKQDYHLSEKELPPVLLSFLPVIVPLFLITIKSVAGLIDRTGENIISRIFYLPGDPVLALAVGATLALLLLKKRNIESLNQIFTEAIEKAGPILIVTAAGGMFGMVIRTTGIGEAAGAFFSGSGLGLFIPFLIAAILKTAQGSSTVAIITAASFVAPMMNVLGLNTEWGRLLGMLSMGAGSMMVSHANDSYFWVISTFSDMNISTTLKVYSTSTIIMGLTVFTCIYVLSIFVL